MEVVRGELSHTQDGLLAFILHYVSVVRFLCLTDQPLLQAGDHLTLRVEILIKGKKHGGGGVGLGIQSNLKLFKIVQKIPMWFLMLDKTVICSKKHLERHWLEFVHHWLESVHHWLGDTFPVVHENQALQ